MPNLKMFKAAKDTRRWRENQKVWIQHTDGDYLDVVFKWRGRGRYVTGRCRRHFNPAVGEVHELDVGQGFVDFVRNFRNSA